MAQKIRVTVWNENIHEREHEHIRKIYPEGTHGAIASFLKKQPDLEVRTATQEQPEHGLTEKVLAETDVARADVQHVYLRGATALRLDLAQ